MSAVIDIDALEALAHATLLDSMRTKALSTHKWFDITGLSPLGKLFDDQADTAARKTREFKLLRRLHCEPFDSIPPPIREALPALFDAVIDAARADFISRAQS